MNRQLLKRIEEIFIEKLSVKTNWGHNQILTVYRDAVIEATMEILDKQ